jgi:PPOX class probable F420-dependent enzyme
MLNAAQARLLTEPNPAIVTTLRRDGGAHSSLVWVDWDGEYVIVNTTVGRIKERHLRRDNRITVCVVDRTNTNFYVGVAGHAELITEGAAEHVNGLSQRYRGVDFTFKEGMMRIMARFRPRRVWGIWDEMEEDKLKAGRDWEQHSHLDIRSSKAR